MTKAGTIYLITEESRAHGVHEETVPTKRPVLCTVRSVRMTEYYTAMNAGMMPQYQFDLALAEDWHGERKLEFGGKIYDILRTYEREDGGIDITAGRSDVNEPDENGE